MNRAIIGTGCRRTRQVCQLHFNHLMIPALLVQDGGCGTSEAMSRHHISWVAQISQTIRQNILTHLFAAVPLVGENIL